MLFRTIALGAVIGTVSAGQVAAQITPQDYRMQNGADLVRLCSAPESDPNHMTALAYCFGFGDGAIAYHRATRAAGTQLFCPPPDRPQRTPRQTIEDFVSWARGNQQYLSESPVDVIFRWLDARYPCKK